MVNKNRQKGEYGSGTITPRGKDSYYLRWRAEGRRYSKTFHGSEREAKKEMRRIMAEVDARKFRPPTKLTVADITNGWLESRDGVVEKKTHSDYTSKCKYHIIPAFGSIPVDNMDTETIQKWINKAKKDGSAVKNRPLSGQTIKHCITILHAIFEYALDKDDAPITRNPVNKRKLTIPRITGVEYPRLTKEELKHLLSLFKGHYFEVAVWIACFTGLRRGEILALTWDDISFEDMTITVRSSVSEANREVFLKPTKTVESAATIPMVGILASKLQEYKKTCKTHYIVTNPDGSLGNPNRFTRVFSDKVAEGMKKHVRLHDLRHQVAEILRGQGVDLKTISSILRHSNIQISANMYMHKDLEQERKAMEGLADFLEQ